MHSFLMRQRARFWRHSVAWPIALSLIVGIGYAVLRLVGQLLAGGSSGGPLRSLGSLLVMGVFAAAFVVYPFVLTALNLLFFLRCPADRARQRAALITELITLFLGAFYSALYISFSNIRWVSWDVQLINAERHALIAPEHMPSVAAVALLAIVGYLVLRLRPVLHLPPLVAVFSLAALYGGIALCVVWILQVWGAMSGSLFLVLYPANVILILAKLVREQVWLWQEGQKQAQTPPATAPEAAGQGWRARLRRELEDARRWPLLAALAALPLLGLLLIVLLLFGQRPDSLILAWRDTADWNLSQRIAPPNQFTDSHYLCTVAAAGHPRLVRPLRRGRRGGRPILVNRQLSVANAFEQLLEERVPRLHRRLRDFYDRRGYPISRHITTPWRADLVYLLMKPAEWCFLLVLYLCDVAPEARIARQYRG